MAYLGRPGATAPLTSSDIPDGSITSAKIVDGAVAVADLGPNSVDSSELVDGSVDLSHMSANSVDSDQYVDGSIDNAHLADDAVGVAELSATGTPTNSTFLRGDNVWTNSLVNRSLYTGEVVVVKVAIFSADGSNYLDPGSASTWVGTSSSLNLTHALNHANNMLIFTVMTSNMYISSSRELNVGVGFTSDLTGDDANIIRYASEGPGGDDAKGKSATTGVTALTGLSATWTFKYLPATTVSKIYQPIMHGDGSTDSHLVTNNDEGYVFFSLTEVQLG